MKGCSFFLKSLRPFDPVYQQVTPVIKSPTQSRGVGLLVLQDPSQETFDHALKGYSEPLILAETFVKNIHLNSGEERQTSVRYFVLFDGGTHKASVFAKRHDYAETQFPRAEDTLTNKSAICHSSLASDFRFVSDFSPNEQELRLETDLGRLITVMKSTTPHELREYIHTSEHKDALLDLSNTMKDFWVYLKLTNFFLNLDISSSGLDILKTESGQIRFRDQYLELLSTVQRDIDSDIAEKWANLRLWILDVAKPFLVKDSALELVAKMESLFADPRMFQHENITVLQVYRLLFRELVDLTR